ncbi:kelch-like protein 9 isoform X1 [Lethenteron reissneri]|uniref:kelch-like protein 9 isoform X1 n=2 Tax=Lethenteron reissneri TaxID=7753 RepID=UPI002AB6E44A|nr:kelch-like protein 9 isoform X1 [Lethenteron reissneri]
MSKFRLRRPCSCLIGRAVPAADKMRVQSRYMGDEGKAAMRALPMEGEPCPRAALAVSNCKPAGGTRVFTSNTHSAHVVQGFERLRSEGHLCDVTLLPGDGDEAFPVHRAMMASASDYFKAMFTGGMMEQEQGCIRLHGVSAAGLRQIVAFIYTARLPLSMDSLADTLEAASFLQILPVLAFCKDFLISEVTLENCVDIGRIATAYHLPEVDKYVNAFLLRSFTSLLATGEFLRLPFERLAWALGSDSLRGCSELQLFQAACRWLRHPVDAQGDSLSPARDAAATAAMPGAAERASGSRLEFASRLMSRIRFPLMSPQELLAHVQTVDFMRSDAACLNLLLEASNYQMLPAMQPVLQSERTRVRSDATHLLALGGVLRQQLLVSRDMRIYDERARRWRCLTPMDAPRYQHGIAVVGNFLFVVGGQSNYDTKGKTAVDTVFRYDPRYDRWAHMTPLNEKRTFFHLSALNGRLYAVGGRNASGELATVECYSPASNEWTFVARMSEPHYGHAGTVYSGLMYISGGITHDTFQKGLMSYEPETDRWAQRAPMSTVRGLHCMCTVRERLYAIGGNHFRGASDYDDVLSCEFYSPASDQWTSVAPMPRGQSDVGVAVFGERVYVVGGYSWNSRCMVEIVQRYDPERDSWERAFDLPESLGGIRACAITVLPPPDGQGGEDAAGGAQTPQQQQPQQPQQQLLHERGAEGLEASPQHDGIAHGTP